MLAKFQCFVATRGYSHGTDLGVLRDTKQNKRKHRLSLQRAAAQQKKGCTPTYYSAVRSESIITGSQNSKCKPSEQECKLCFGLVHFKNNIYNFKSCS